MIQKKKKKKKKTLMKSKSIQPSVELLALQWPPLNLSIRRGMNPDHGLFNERLGGEEERKRKSGSKNKKKFISM
jgi:hypothetical protein